MLLGYNLDELPIYENTTTISATFCHPSPVQSDELEADQTLVQDSEQPSCTNRACITEKATYKDIVTTIFQLQVYYHFLKFVDIGGKNAIFYALDRNTNLNLASCNKVCIKIFTLGDDTVPKEIRILEHIRRKGGHPNLQKILAVYKFKKYWILVSQYYHHGSTSVMRANMSSLMFQLLQALSFLHQHNVIHRDVKLSNLLWNDKTKHLVLCDFDLSMWQQDACYRTGTVGFIAPEVLNLQRDTGKRKKEEYGPKIDCYSSGVVLGCLIFDVGECQMKEEYVVKWRKNIFDMSQVDLMLQQLFMGLVSYNPKNRLSVAEALNLFPKKLPDQEEKL